MGDNVKQTFFKKCSILAIKNVKSSKNTIADIEPNEYIVSLKGEYKVLAYFTNEVKFGRISNGVLSFADDKCVETDDLLELRVFRADEEHFIKRGAAGFTVRIILDIEYIAGEDEADENKSGERLECVETDSNLFGEADNLAAPSGYVRLCENGRKISLTVPVDVAAKHYALRTRSYITYDNDTKQAGFGYYRFVDIVPVI